MVLQLDAEILQQERTLRAEMQTVPEEQVAEVKAEVQAKFVQKAEMEALEARFAEVEARFEARFSAADVRKAEVEAELATLRIHSEEWCRYRLRIVCGEIWNFVTLRRGVPASTSYFSRDALSHIATIATSLRLDPREIQQKAWECIGGRNSAAHVSTVAELDEAVLSCQRIFSDFPNLVDQMADHHFTIWHYSRIKLLIPGVFE